jgi:hypothetical protein
MPDQLLMYSVENPLMIISITVGGGEVMVIRLVIDYGELVKVALKKKGVAWEVQWVGRFRYMVAAEFYGPCVCSSVFLLL